MMTPTQQQMAGSTPEAIAAMRMQADIMRRNRPFTDAELDEVLPGSKDGFEIVDAPEGYAPVLNAARLAATPTPLDQGLYQVPTFPTGAGASTKCWFCHT